MDSRKWFDTKTITGFIIGTVSIALIFAYIIYDNMILSDDSDKDKIAMDNEKSECIKRIKSFKEVDFSKIQGSDTIVIFAVDDVLIQAEDSYFSNLDDYYTKGEAIEWMNYLIFHKYEYESSKLLPSVLDELLAKALTTCSRPLIENDILEKIKLLRTNKVTVFGLSGRFVINENKPIEYMAQWRYNQLDTIGFNGDYQKKVFAIKNISDTTDPMFYKGIIFTDSEGIPRVLEETFKGLAIKPKKIVIFYDNFESLYFVYKMCKKESILFEGYQYTGAKKKFLDKKIIDFQVKYLLENKKWISDTEVKKMIDNRK